MKIIIAKNENEGENLFWSMRVFDVRAYVTVYIRGSNDSANKRIPSNLLVLDLQARSMA